MTGASLRLETVRSRRDVPDRGGWGGWAGWGGDQEELRRCTRTVQGRKEGFRSRRAP